MAKATMPAMCLSAITAPTTDEVVLTLKQVLAKSKKLIKPGFDRQLKELLEICKQTKATQFDRVKRLLEERPRYQDAELSSEWDSGFHDPNFDSKFATNLELFRDFLNLLAKELGPNFWEIRINTDPLSDDVILYSIRELHDDDSKNEAWHPMLQANEHRTWPFGAKLMEYYSRSPEHFAHFLINRSKCFISILPETSEEFYSFDESVLTKI